MDGAMGVKLGTLEASPGSIGWSAPGIPRRGVPGRTSDDPILHLRAKQDMAGDGRRWQAMAGR